MRALSLALALCVAIVVLVTLLAPTPVEASHFAYGSISWNRVGAVGTYNFVYVVEMAYRRSFYSPAPTLGPPASSGHTAGTIQWLYAATASGPFSSQEGSTLTVGLTVVAVYSLDDYFIGTWTRTYTVLRPTQIYQLSFYMSARVNYISDANAGRDCRVIAYQDPNECCSPRTSAFPRAYLAVNIAGTYVVNAVSPQQYSLDYILSTAAESSLSVLIPVGATFSSTGTFSWRPTLLNGIYAWQCRIRDGKSSTPLDILFQIVDGTGNPTFIPPLPETLMASGAATFYRGVQKSFILQSTCIDVTTTTAIDPGPLPDHASFDWVSSVGPLSTYTVTWQPDLSQPSFLVCFQARESKYQLKSLGSYCITLQIGTASLIYVSGIVRDFHNAPSPVRTPKDFNNPLQAADNGTVNQFVSTTLSTGGKPVWSGAARTSVISSQFDQWWNTDPLGLYNTEVVLSTTLSNGTNPNAGVFTFLSTEYYPIDGLGFGNEGDTHNRFYTYEIHTYLTYNGTEIFNIQSSDDLWIFINNKLPSGWNLNGIHPLTPFSINMPLQASTLGIAVGGTYRLDIFFACRSSAHLCGFKLELPNAILCDAIQSGTVILNVGIGAFTSTTVFVLGASSVLAATGEVRVIPVGALSDSAAVWYSGGAATPQRLKMLHGFETEFDFIVRNATNATNPPEGFAFVIQDQSSGARGGEGGNLGYSQITNSLAVEFDMTANTENADPFDRCSGGTNKTYQHVSFHTGRTLPNSASEAYSIGASSCPGTSKLTLTMHNATWHRVRITYTPAKDDPSGGPQLGWIRVFMSIVNDQGVVRTTVIAPIAEAQVDGLVLQQMWDGGAAYAGFTASSNDVNRANIDIRRWTMTIVPPSPPFTTAATGTTPLAVIRAGTTGAATIRARDSCQNDIKTGGDLSLFTSTFVRTIGGTTYPVTIADNQDGTYAFSYTPTRTGTYRVNVLMGGVPIAENKSPYPYSQVVASGPTVAAQSIYIYTPQIDMAYSNSPLSNSLYVVAVEPTYGDLLLRTAYDLNNNATLEIIRLASQISRLPTGSIVTVAFAGNVPAITSLSGLAAILNSVGATSGATVGAAGVSYCSIGIYTGAATGTNTAQSVVTIDETTMLKAAFSSAPNQFSMWCQSGGQGLGNYGVILVVPAVIHVPAGVPTNIWIEARDQYSNLNTDGGDPFSIAFSPDISGYGLPNAVGAPGAVYDGHYVAQFTCVVAGKLSMFVKLGSTNIVASPVDIFVDAGLAVASKSSAVGIGLVSAQAGEFQSFDLLLYDNYGNQVTAFNHKDVILPPALRLGTTSTYVYAVCAWVSSTLTCTYNATVTGTYSLVVTINGGVMPQSTPVSITVVAALPVRAKAYAFGAGIPQTTTVAAGSEVQFWIQSVDRFNNLVTVESPATAPYVYSATFAPSTSTYVTILNTAPQYDNVGKYSIRYVPKIKGPSLQITCLMGGLQIPLQPLQITVVPGPASSLSTLAAPLSPIVAGVVNTVSLTSIDAYGNTRDVAPFDGATSYVVTFKTTGAIDIRGTTAITGSGSATYQLQYASTVAGTYTLGVTTTGGSSILGSGATIVVNPAATNTSHCVVSGPGATTGVSGVQTTFFIQARDTFDNNQINWSDVFAVTIDGSTTGVTIVATANQGQFLVTYSAPVIVGGKSNYIIIASRGGQSFYTFTASLFANAQDSFAKPISGGYTGRGSTALPLVAKTNVASFFTIHDYSDITYTADRTVGNAGTFFTVVINSTTGNYQVPTYTIAPAVGVASTVDYLVSYTPQLAGTYTVEIRYLGAYLVKQVPQTLTVLAGDPDALKSKVIGLPVTEVAGVSTRFQVLLLDSNSQNVTDTTPVVAYSIGTATPTTGACVHSGSYNIYNCVYTLFTAGTYAVQVTVSARSLIVPGSITVVANVAHANSTATYIGSDSLPADLRAITLVAGTPFSFDVHVVDQYGNNALTSGAGGTFTPAFTFVAALNDAVLTTGTFSTAFTSPSTQGAFTVSYGPRASYFSVSFTPTKTSVTAVPWALSIKIGGKDIIASPFSVTVTPAAISNANSPATGFPTSIVAGDTVNFTIAAHDMYNNAWLSQQFAIAASATAPLVAGNTLQSTSATVTPVSGQPGVYRVVVDGAGTKVAGDYSWSFTSTTDGLTFTPSGVTITTAIPGPTDPQQTLLPSSVDNALSNVASSITIQLCDKWGNYRIGGTQATDRVELRFVAGSTSCLLYNEAGQFIADGVAATAQVDRTGVFISRTAGNSGSTGEWTLTYQTLTTGTYTMNITINGVAIGCVKIQKLSFVVGAGVATAATSTYSVLAPGIAGDGQQISVQLRDAQGNKIDSDRAGTIISVGVFFPGIIASLGVGGYPGGGAVPLDSAATPWFQPTFTQGTVGQFASEMVLYNKTGITMCYVTDGLYYLNLRTPLAAEYVFVMSLSGTNIVQGNTVVILQAPIRGVNNYTVSPAPPARFMTPVFPSARAGIPASFIIQGADINYNAIQTVTHTYVIVFKRGSYTFTINSASTGQNTITPLAAGTGQHRVDFTSSWNGVFDITISLYLPGKLSDTWTVPYKNITILHATCAYEYPTRPYRCLDGTCVNAYSACPALTPVCTAAQVMCAGSPNTCASSYAACPCPGAIARCPDGHCPATSVNECLPVHGCYGDAPFACLLNGVPSGVCRASAADCPTQLVCPPGTAMCPSLQQCAVDLTECDTTTFTTDCPLPGQLHCANGQCVYDIEDCSTGVTCKSGVLCPDGSCQTSNQFCPNQYDCYAPSPFRCPLGQCRVSADQCPTLSSCPIGNVLCPTGECMASVSLCPAQTTGACSLSTVRCDDGSCQNNLLFCPSATTCPAAKPTLCTDGSCTTSAYLCPAPRTCNTGYTLCGDGTCVLPNQPCPSRLVCPVSSPALCSDGSCTADISLCSVVPSCSLTTPFHCPDGSCRASLVDCPSQSACAADAPVRCPDGSCGFAPDTCLAVVECATGLTRCPGGECAQSQALCPTHVTCPLGTIKCLDGTCRDSCPDVKIPDCGTGNITCPQAGFGVQCAAALAQCPQAPVCPADKPVKCVDVTCATTSAQCPPAPTDFPDNKVACPDWTFKPDITQCGTAVTCPDSAPYKCYDDSCRPSPLDCPVAPSCNGTTPYLCPNGICSATLWASTCDSANKVCDTFTPVKCTSGDCVVSIDQCAQAVSIGDTTTCPVSWTRCRDGSCVSSPVYCADLSCPVTLPYLCVNGLCATDVDQCTRSNGCPADRPQKCVPGGNCVKNGFTDCPASVTCPAFAPQICPDGSCAIAGAGACLAAWDNGCPASSVRPTLCLDGTCVRPPTAGTTEVNQCIAGAATANTCPTTAPYQCDNGFCAGSSLLCPKLPPISCPSATPAQCADGSCVISLIQCPLVKPCATGYRCGDGSCRDDVAACPISSTCPTAIPFRCESGLCALNLAACISVTSGCPGAFPQKCPNGVCYNNLTTDCSMASLTMPSNGCPTARPTKCWDGACVQNDTVCRLINTGCPYNLPFRCSIDRACVALPSACATHTTPCAANMVCADGSCAPSSSVANCLGLNGCNVKTPVRCGNGDCAATADDCPISVVCDTAAGQVACFDGRCVSSYTECRPATLCSGTTLYRCPDLTCATSAATCPPRGCPSTAPVLCTSGVCKSSLGQCPSSSAGGVTGGSGSGTGATGTQTSTSSGSAIDPTRPQCTSAAPIECFDGSCRATYSACQAWNAAVNSVTYSNTQPVTICAVGSTLCPNGACVTSQWSCPVIAACPQARPLRCTDGSCTNATCTAIASCASGYLRCEDGTCRAKCLQFDGCPLKLPFHCANRECSLALGGCPAAANFDPAFALKRRLLASSSTGSATGTGSGTTVSICYTNCYAEIKATSSDYTIDPTQANQIVIAVDSARATAMQVSVSGGSLVKFDNSNLTAPLKFYVHAVADSRMRETVDKVTLSRRSTFGVYLPYSAALLSAAFECAVDAFIIQPFPVPIGVTASIDMTRLPLYNDVCLAWVFYITSVNFAAWKCVDRTDDARASHPVRTAAANRTLATNVVSGTLELCNVQSNIRTGTIYGFIHAPARAVSLGSAAEDTFWADNIIWIVLGFCGLGAILALVVYAAKRLHRYRTKYKTETGKVKEMTEEVENMEQYGGQAGTKDEQLEMMSNPMVVQMQDMQARLDSKNAEVLLEEKKTREEQSEARQEHISALQDDRNKLAEELERLKAELALSQPAGRPVAAVAVPVSGTGAVRAGVPAKRAEPVRAQFDTGRPAARKKKGEDD